MADDFGVARHAGGHHGHAHGQGLAQGAGQALAAGGRVDRYIEGGQEPGYVVAKTGEHDPLGESQAAKLGGEILGVRVAHRQKAGLGGPGGHLGGGLEKIREALAGPHVAHNTHQGRVGPDAKLLAHALAADTGVEQLLVYAAVYDGDLLRRHPAALGDDAAHALGVGDDAGDPARAVFRRVAEGKRPGNTAVGQKHGRRPPKARRQGEGKGRALVGLKHLEALGPQQAAERGERLPKAKAAHGEEVQGYLRGGVAGELGGEVLAPAGVGAVNTVDAVPPPVKRAGELRHLHGPAALYPALRGHEQNFQGHRARRRRRGALGGGLGVSRFSLSGGCGRHGRKGSRGLTRVTMTSAGTGGKRAACKAARLW